MKRLTIRSQKYQSELEDFAAKAIAAELIKTGNIKGNTLKLTITETETFCEMLMNLLADAAEMENPIYKNSVKLRKMARDLRRTPAYIRELRQLKEFTAGSKELNIEGYVTFRMSEYKEKLDMMMYSIVKKIKFSNRD